MASGAVTAGGFGAVRRRGRPGDVHALARLPASEYPHVEFNIEGNPAAGPRDNGYPGFDHLIETARPHQATLVPDADARLISDHGWDLSDPAEAGRVAEIVARYRGWGMCVSLFMDPVEEQIARARNAARIGSSCIPAPTPAWSNGTDSITLKPAPAGSPISTPCVMR